MYIDTKANRGDAEEQLGRKKEKISLDVDLSRNSAQLAREKFNQPSDNRTTPYGICIYDYIVPHDNI